MKNVFYHYISYDQGSLHDAKSDMTCAELIF